MTSEIRLAWPDFVVIGIYFILVLAVGIWTGRRGKQDSLAGYFMASRNMSWLPVGASLFASNIGSGHFIGLSGSGAAAGIGMAVFELNATYIFMILGYIFIPVYMASGVYTMPEYLRKRFGGQRIRVYLSVLSLILYVFTKISADLFAGALFIKQSMGLAGEQGLYISIVILLAIAALFTITGGLTAVIWTDSVQTVLMLIGAFILMGISFNAVGGYYELVRQFFQAYPNISAYDLNNQSCAVIPDNSMHLLRSADDPYLPWPGVILGVSIGAIWYCCTDQVMVQRTLAAKNMSHAKAACIMTSYLKFLPLYLIVFPGMAARVLFPNTVGCADPAECLRVCGSEAGCTNIAYVELVVELMPTGLAGMMLAVMLAALMSSLTSVFNSSSTIITVDIWTRIRKNATEVELLLVGRVSVLILVAISILWIPIIQQMSSSQLFVYIQQVSNFLAPPIAAVFMLAVLWPRTNEPGAFWGLMAGLLIGLIRFGLEFGYIIPACGTGLPDPRPEIIKTIVGKVNYLHFSALLFGIVCVVTVIVSLLTEPIPEENLYRLTYWSRRNVNVRKDLDANDNINRAKHDDLPSTEDQTTELSSCYKIINTLCCVSKPKAGTDQEKSITETVHLSAEEEAKAAADFLIEEPFWKQFVNTQSVILMSACAFMWGFYA